MLPHNLLTGGELAKLANTTKRTVRWYVQKGIISPNSKNEKGYNFYTAEQVIVLQTLLLLRQFGFSLKEMKKFGGERKTLGKLFVSQKKFLSAEVSKITKTLNEITECSKNLRKNGTLVDPKTKNMPPMEIYYIEKEGPYSKIKKYGFELKDCFTSFPDDAVYTTIFLENAFNPKRARLRIGVIANSEMKLKSDAQGAVKRMVIPKYKALTYVYRGPSTFISLLWQEMFAYMHKKGISSNVSPPFASLEIYRNAPSTEFEEARNMEFELVQPIR